MSDEGKAAVATALWCIAYNSGIILATEHKALGFMLAISATLIFLVYLAEDAKAEHIKSAKDNRLEKYKADCARREQEARKNERK